MTGNDLRSATFGMPPDVLASGTTRVLLVEDDEGDAFLVKELLVDAAPDMVIDRVATLGEAAALLPGDFDCVLLDLGLPDAAGMEALRVIREAQPTMALLVLTGLADEFKGIQAVSYGAQDYLVKGNIDGSLLRRAILYAVERKRADESLRRLFESEARAAENARLERGLLPQPLLSSRGVEVLPRYRPGRHQSLLGGDFYDAVECEDGALFLLIGDVAGHGPDEAAVGVCLRIAWRTLVLAGVEPATILPSMSSVLGTERSSPEVFATVAMARVDVGKQVAHFWLAGHPAPFLLRGGEVTPVPDQTTGIALGIDDQTSWEPVPVPVDADTALMLYTDGLIEGYADERRSRRLGDDGLREMLARRLSAGQTGRDLVEAVLADVREANGGELTDDLALLLVSWAGA